jgi:hypothetical protein
MPKENVFELTSLTYGTFLPTLSPPAPTLVDYYYFGLYILVAQR